MTLRKVKQRAEYNLGQMTLDPPLPHFQRFAILPIWLGWGNLSKPQCLYYIIVATTGAMKILLSMTDSISGSSPTNVHSFPPFMMFASLSHI